MKVMKLVEPIMKAWGLTYFPEAPISVPASETAIAPNKVIEAATIQKELILRGMTAAIDNWTSMGFKSVYEACHKVLDNLELVERQEKEKKTMEDERLDSAFLDSKTGPNRLFK